MDLDGKTHMVPDGETHAPGSDSFDGTIEPLVELARALAAPPRAYAILGEGNVSARLDAETFVVKASGASLATATAVSFTRMDLQRALALVREPPAGDDAVAAALQAAQRQAVPGTRPSVETGLHAVLYATTGARWVAHTHPAPLTAILCSENAAALAAGHLFPDQVVVCGRYPLLLPYVDPGVPLAGALLTAVEAHMATHGGPPRSIYLQNHGFVALGQSPTEALAITDMAVKAAVVLATALACGGARYLPESEVARLAVRSDEHHRQKALGLTLGE